LLNPIRLAQKRNFFYGWAVVFVCCVVISLVFTVRLSFGIFFEALTRPSEGGAEFNWRRADTAGVFSTTMIVFALTSTLVGWLLDRWGARRVMSVGILVVASGLFMTSRMKNLGEFYLYYGIWTGLGITILGLSVHASVISRWFAKAGRRGLAIGVAFSGTGIGILLLAPILERLVSTFGWRVAYQAEAALLLCSLPIVIWLMRDDPALAGLRADGHQLMPNPTRPGMLTAAATPQAEWTFRQAAHTPIFWLLMLSGMFGLFTLRMVSVHQVSYLVDIGFDRLTAATLLGGTGLITALAFIIFGQLSDRIGRANTFYIGSAAQVCALLLLVLLRRDMPQLLTLYALLWGIGEGGRSGLLTAIAGDTFPGPSQGTIIGALGAFFGIGAATGSWLAGWIFDQSGSYNIAFGVALVATLLATLGIGLTHRLAHSYHHI